MATTGANRVREEREARGLSQKALAERACLTRQSVGAIEAGRATPGVDVALRIARALDAPVEELFGADENTKPIRTEPSTHALSGRVAVAHLGGRWVSYPLAGSGARISADGVVTATRSGGVDVAPWRLPDEARDNVVVMGCAGGLGLLADRLNSRPGPGRFLWFPHSSTASLEALARGHTHIAGVHLVDRRTGAENVVDVRHLVGGVPVAMVTLARWQAGLVVAAGNPKNLRRCSDLARRGLRVVTRERGSGARRLLDQQLDKAGVSRVARAAFVQASGHLEVAQAVAIGAGDAGVATRDAAIAFGLDFVPLAEERYDLVIPLAGLRDPRVARFLQTMTTGAVRRELSSLGYDVRRCGDRVAELRAA